MLVALLALVLLSLPVPASAAEKGVVPDVTWGISRADVDRTVALMKDAGVRTARLNASWSAIERDGKGIVDAGALASLDYAVSKTQAAGISVLMPIADGVPYWASADPARYRDGSGNRWNRLYKPRYNSDYAAFVRYIAARYAPRGVHAYEVWNEPNHPHFWPSGVNAAEYVAMLKAAYPAIKQADPAARVLFGGLSKNDYAYLEQMYAAGARGYFDVASIHPYTGTVDPTWCWNQAGTTRKAKDAFCGLEEVRKVMVAKGDSAKPIWVTEFGWSTYSGTWGVSDTKQAEYVKKALVKLESYPYVHKALLYNFRNTYWLRDAASDFEANLGIVRTNFSLKPGFAAFKSYVSPATTVVSRASTAVRRGRRATSARLARGAGPRPAG